MQRTLRALQEALKYTTSAEAIIIDTSNTHLWNPNASGALRTVLGEPAQKAGKEPGEPDG